MLFNGVEGLESVEDMVADAKRLANVVKVVGSSSTKVSFESSSSADSAVSL